MEFVAESIGRIFRNTNGALKVIKLLGKLAFGKLDVIDTRGCARVLRHAIIYAWLTFVYLIQIYSSIVWSTGFHQWSRYDYLTKERICANNKQIIYLFSLDTWFCIYLNHFVIYKCIAMIFLLD